MGQAPIEDLESAAGARCSCGHSKADHDWVYVGSPIRGDERLIHGCDKCSCQGFEESELSASHCFARSARSSKAVNNACSEIESSST